MAKSSTIALTAEQQIVAREDAQQLGFCVDSLRDEVYRLERIGRLTTADRLRETADRMEAERIRLLDAIEGRTPATQERQPNAVEAAMRVAFSLPTLLVRLVLALLTGDAVAASEAASQVEPPVVATPVAVPVAVTADVPTARLAPVLMLTYTPEPTPVETAEPKPARKVRTAKPKAAPMPAPSAARSVEPLFVRRARGYVEADRAKPRQGETLYRCVGGKGKAKRYAAV